MEQETRDGNPGTGTHSVENASESPHHFHYGVNRRNVGSFLPHLSKDAMNYHLVEITLSPRLNPAVPFVGFAVQPVVGLLGICRAQFCAVRIFLFPLQKVRLAFCRQETIN